MVLDEDFGSHHDPASSGSALLAAYEEKQIVMRDKSKPASPRAVVAPTTSSLSHVVHGSLLAAHNKAKEDTKAGVSVIPAGGDHLHEVQTHRQILYEAERRRRAEERREMLVNLEDEEETVSSATATTDDAEQIKCAL